MEIWLWFVNRTPAQKMWSVALVAAFVEVASQTLGSALQPQQREWDNLHHPPLLSRATRVTGGFGEWAKAAYLVHLLCVEEGCLGAWDSLGGKHCADAVHLKIEISLTRRVLHEELHAAILPYILLGTHRHRTQMILLHLEHHRQSIVGVGDTERHLWSLRVLLPIHTSHLVAGHTIAHHKSYFVVAELFDLANKTSLNLLWGGCHSGGCWSFHFRVVLSVFWLCCVNSFTANIIQNYKTKMKKSIVWQIFFLVSNILLGLRIIWQSHVGRALLAVM